jgi:hypothetical protein
MCRASAASVAAVEVNRTQVSRFLRFGLRTYVGDRLDVRFPHYLVVTDWTSSSLSGSDASVDIEIDQNLWRGYVLCSRITVILT